MYDSLRTNLLSFTICYFIVSLLPVLTFELDIFSSSLIADKLTKKHDDHELSNYYLVEHCILATFTTYLITKEGNRIKFDNGIVDKESSSCESEQSRQLTLAINFDVANLVIRVNQMKSLIYINSIDGNYYRRGSQVSFSNESTMFAVTRVGYHYKCNSEQAMSVGDGQVLLMSNLVLEAYRNSTSEKFLFAEDECPLDSVSGSTTLIQWVIVVLLFVTIVSLTILCRWLAAQGGPN